MGRIKKFNRVLSVMMVLIMLFTSIGIEQFKVEAKEQNSNIKLYFVDNTESHWVKNDNAVIEAVDNTSGHDHYVMTKENDETWSVEVPSTAYNITFNRLNSDGTVQWNSWSAGGRDSNNTYYADGAEYGHWEYSEESNENYFHAGDIVYLDLNEFIYWENDAALLYVNFSKETKNKGDKKDVDLSEVDSNIYKPIKLDYIEETHVYAYIISKSDEGKDCLRFWRGNENSLWNDSIVLDYNNFKKGDNCVCITDWEESGYLCKKNYKANVDVDQDKDGLSDYLEAILGLDKSKVDTDDDGLTDYDEFVKTKTNPAVYDSVEKGLADSEIDLDYDGLINKTEIELGTNPVIVDTDGDELTDYEEVYDYFTNPLVEDTDNDKLNDSDEHVLGFNPLEKDTDKNGIIDGEEYVQQGVNADRFSDDIYENNLALPVDLNVSAQGNVNNNISISEYVGALTGDDRSYVGKIIEISGAEIESGSLSFKLNDKYKPKNYELFGENTNGLVICFNDGENTVPLVTTYNDEERKLTASISEQGIYFVLDVMDWANSLGLDYRHQNIDRIVENIDNKDAISTSEVKIKGQTDIVFIIDTTGSMESCVNNVKSNINYFVDEITAAGITPNFALVEYKDITNDGNNSTNVKKNTDNSNWFKSTADFKNELSKLWMSGGGDYEETAIDALEMARRLDLNKTSQKFFILITDAGYKINNNYGIKSMDEMIESLKEDGINVSVVTEDYNKLTYESLYSQTGGIFANVRGNFKKELLSIADIIAEETNNGHWIALDGLPVQYAKLKKEPIKNDTTDTDGDSIYDWNELDDLKNVKKLYIAPFLLAINPKIDQDKLPDDYINVYGFTSNPVKIDTDNDGLLDGKPTYVQYTNTQGIIETLEAAPKDSNPKKYTGDKNLWKTHIDSMKKGDKLSTEDSDNYYEPIDVYVDFGWSGFHPTIDTNIVDSLKSMLASDQSLACDFRYDAENIALHSYDFQWQVIGGYNNMYDVVFDTFSDMSKRKYTFDYNAKEYALWTWKGNYWGLGPGSEIAVYERDINIGLWYFSDYYNMNCSLYEAKEKNTYSPIYNWYPQQNQWWTTGFAPNHDKIDSKKMRQISSVQFSTKGMYDAFKKSVGGEIEDEEIIFDEYEMKVWFVW